jgi:flavin reductase ActVB
MVTPEAFREALAHVPTAVSVITTLSTSGEPWGVTVGTLASLSLSPPLLLFCLDRSSASHEVVTTSARFLAHVLADHQSDIAASFARHGGHGFGNGYPTAHGLPAIPHAVTRFLCVQETLIRGGDHTIVIGSVDKTEIGPGTPLLYHERGYCSLKRRTECPASPVIAGSVGS